MVKTLISKLNRVLIVAARVFPPGHPVRAHLSQLWSHWLSKHAKSISIWVAGEEMEVDFRLRWMPPDYEGESLRSFLHLAKKGDVVWDIGAYVGIYAVLAAKKVGPTGRVFAWEPDPASFSFLSFHTKQNSFNDVILPIQAAFSDGQATEVTFQSGLEVYGRLNVGGSDKSTGRSIKVPAKSMDQWAESLKVCPDIIKMDIEGAEFLALKAAKELMLGKLGKRPLLLLSVHVYTLSEFGHTLAQLNEIPTQYGYVVLSTYGDRTSFQKHSEYWVVPRERSEEVAVSLKNLHHASLTVKAAA